MKRIIKIILLFSFVLFIILFFNRNNTMYENRNIISSEAIKQFEKDLREGKEIVPSHYLTPKKDYGNRISKYTLKLSKVLEYLFQHSLRKVLKYIAK